MSGLDVSLAVSHRYGSDKKFPNVKKSYIYIYIYIYIKTTQVFMKSKSTSNSGLLIQIDLMKSVNLQLR
jgi:hypothetical protein